MSFISRFPMLQELAGMAMLATALFVIGFLGLLAKFGPRDRDRLLQADDLKDERPPRYEHDCVRCHYLGRHGKHDLYIHVGWDHKHTMLKARSGTYPWQLKTGPLTTWREPLREAYERAKNSGFKSDIYRAFGKPTQ